VRVLWLSPRNICPPNTGAKLREFFLAKALGEIAHLTYVHFREPNAYQPSASDLPFCDKVFSIQKPQSYTTIKLVKGLLGKWPLPIENYLSERMFHVLNQLDTGQRFDVVHLESIHLAPYKGVFKDYKPRVIVDWHNIESEALDRFSRNQPYRPKQLYANVTTRRMRDLERQMLATSTGHIVCSTREERVLADLAPNVRIATVPNGVDASSFSENRLQLNWPPSKIIFVGAMDYYPNIDAVQFFVKNLWSQLRSQFPLCRFVIVGSNPSPDVLALREISGVDVTGTVEDVRSYYNEADLCVVPLRMGGGTRLKVLEALAAGVPVVSSVLGAEGLQLEHGRHLILADCKDPESWICAIASLGQSAEYRYSLATAGMRFVREHYDWVSIGRLFCEIYVDWIIRQ
jgi:polysaccharide biosynthesis protein PslH